MKNIFDSSFIVKLLKHLPVQIFLKDAKGVYLWCNDVFAQSLGLASQDQVIGKTDFTLPVKIKEAKAYRKDDLEVIQTSQPKLNIEEEQTFPNGKKLFLLTSKVPLSSQSNGVVDCVLGIYSDITELNRLKIEKERALAASKSKSDFIANMSHDLHTPITEMLGMIQDMLNTADHAKALSDDINVSQHAAVLHNMIDTVQRDGELLMGATDELLQLCNEILEVVRLESGESTHQSESFNLHDIVEHNIELFQPTAHHKNLQLSYSIDPNVPDYLNGSRLYLTRVLLNLMSNALKFTQAGTVKVSAEALVSSGGDVKVGETITIRILVEDTGIGIPKDKFDTIFEHFSRLTPSYEGSYPGAGLGLYTVIISKRCRVTSMLVAN